jgi:hypothetical protein
LEIKDLMGKFQTPLIFRWENSNAPLHCLPDFPNVIKPPLLHNGTVLDNILPVSLFSFLSYFSLNNASWDVC